MKINADILLLAPGYDDCRPSEKAVRRMERLIENSGKCRSIKVVTYPEGSHILATDLDATPDRLKKMHKTIRTEVNDPGLEPALLRILTSLLFTFGI